MAAFCSKCSPFDDQYDIDLLKIALSLEPGHSANIVCEGCNICMVYKDRSGNIFLGRGLNGTVQMHPVRIEELMV